MFIPSWLRGAKRPTTGSHAARQASRPRIRLESLESRDVPSLVPLGAEFQVSASNYAAAHPALTVRPDGGFNAVWDELGTDGNSWGVFGRRYDSAGQPLNSPIQVNTTTAGSQFVWGCSMASDSAGNSIVVWQSEGNGVYARRYAADGSALGPEFRLNAFPYASGQATSPTVAMNASGRFVATWIDYRNGTWDTYARVFDSSGVATSDEFQVNQFTPNSQYNSSAAIADDGTFVVVWQSRDQDGSGWGVYGRRYSSDGTPLGSEFPVNTFTDGSQSYSTVAMDGAGNFVIGWEGPGASDTYGIFARRFNSAGDAQGPEFVVNATFASNQFKSNIAMSPTGNFVFAWESDAGATPSLLIRGFNSAGIPQGTEQVVTTQVQASVDGILIPGIAMHSDGDVVVAWRRFASGSKPNQARTYRIFARRYEETGPTPPAISIGAVGLAEGNSGTATASFSVTLSAPSTQTVTVEFSTANGTATALDDYHATFGTLSFSPGEMSKTVLVPIVGDLFGEANETFFVNLSNPTNATIADAQGVGTILDDEPRISISDVSMAEGNSGTKLFTFTVTLSAALSENVTMSFRTLNGTATSTGGQADYVAQTDSIMIPAGATVATIEIVVKGDAKKEGNETFSVELFGLLSNKAWLADNLGLGTIVNDD